MTSEILCIDETVEKHIQTHLPPLSDPLLF